ncbi:MAG: hypothetical protein QOJ68_2510 [Blastococcus sp.]|jgi:hypothetical protein|nr:hypothetical protein [Blastococcus sp.]
MSTDRTTRTRGLAGSWLGLGAFLVIRPGRALAVVGQPAPPPGLVTVTRVLGARTAVQNLVVLVAPSRPVVRAGAAVDTLHALSMLGAALRWPAYRRAALASGAMAAVSAALGRASAPRR